MVNVMKYEILPSLTVLEVNNAYYVNNLLGLYYPYAGNGNLSRSLEIYISAGDFLSHRVFTTDHLAMLGVAL